MIAEIALDVFRGNLSFPLIFSTFFHIVVDLERRLEFARENAVDAVNEKDKASQRIKSLIGEQS
jgi:hypothetical protein